MIRIFENSKVYVMCPAGVATGGPELLHQFAYLLRKKGVDALMYYMPTNMDNPTHEAYMQYNVPFVREVEDSEKNLLVTCEIYNNVKACANFHNIRKCLWWLSIDNFFLTRPLDGLLDRWYSNIRWIIDSLLYKYTKRSYFDLAAYTMKKYRDFVLNDDPLLNGFQYHFYQSEYARQTLLQMGVAENLVYPLSDYLNTQFIEENKETDTSRKQDIVLYYPRKGKKFTSKLIKKAKDKFRFVPIVGLTRAQMVDLLKTAKVYIDFGHHPGKDRIPREAAICKCCVITGRRGAAANDIDISIPQSYKFSEQSIPDIVERISNCLNKYDESIKDFEKYRESIMNEYVVFKDQIDKIIEL